MEKTYLAALILIVVASIIVYLLSYERGGQIARSSKVGFQPAYYAWYAALWCALPAFAAWLSWHFMAPLFIEWQLGNLPQAESEFEQSFIRRDILAMVRGYAPIKAEFADIVYSYRNLEANSNAGLIVAVFALVIIGGTWGYHQTRISFNARHPVERTIKWFLFLSSTVAVITTIGIVLSILFESIKFFQKVSLGEFLFGLNWSPQMAIREGQMASSGAFGSVPLLAGTALISAIAMLVAVPIGLMSAIYLSEYANQRVRAIIKPAMELLAGIPTIVYGFFAILVLAPAMRQAGSTAGIPVSSESALAAGLAMGIMLIPFISSLSDDVIRAVPNSLREGSYSLGATRSETIRQIVLPAAMPGIVSSVLLAVSRAIGETMIVVMAAGLAANLTVNPMEAVTTVTVQIVSVITGDQMFDSPKTLSAFALGLQLFIITLALNVIALSMVRHYHERYE